MLEGCEESYQFKIESLLSHRVQQHELHGLLGHSAQRRGRRNKGSVGINLLSKGMRGLEMGAHSRHSVPQQEEGYGREDARHQQTNHAEQPAGACFNLSQSKDQSSNKLGVSTAL